MKHLFFTLIFVLPFSLAAQQITREKAGLMGPVHTIKLIREEIIRDSSFTKRNPELTTYNVDGTINSLQIFNSHTQELVQEEKYEYARGLVVKKTVDTKVSILAGVTEERFIYNENKQLLETYTYEGETGKIPEKLTAKKTFRYDKKGNWIWEKQLDITLNNTEKINLHSYNDKGQEICTENIRYGMRWQYTEYTYNKSKQVKTETIRDDDGRAKMVYIYDYDSLGHPAVTESLQYNYGGTVVMSRSITINTFRNELLIDTETESNGQKDYKAEYQYADFDKYGNWLTRKIVHNGTLTQLDKRIIDYF